MSKWSEKPTKILLMKKDIDMLCVLMKMVAVVI